MSKKHNSRSVHYLPPVAKRPSFMNPYGLATILCGTAAERFTRDPETVSCGDCAEAPGFPAQFKEKALENWKESHKHR